MTLEEYNQIIEKLKQCVEYYKKISTKKVIFTYYLSGDNKNISYMLRGNHIAHLLGVKTEILNNYARGNNTTYQLLNYLVDHSRFIFNKLSTDGKTINSKLLFSEYIMEKIAGFLTLIKFDLRNIFAVIELDKEKTYQNEYEEELMEVEYIIVKNDGSKYVLLGIGKDLKDRFFPLTNMTVEKNEISKFSKYFQKQNIYIISNAIMYDIENKKVDTRAWYAPDEKRTLVDEVQMFAEQYSMSFCLENEYKYLSDIASNTQNKLEYLKKQLLNIATKITNGEPIEISISEEAEEENEEVVELESLIDAISDKLYSRGRKNSAPYSALKKELLDEKKKREKLEKENQKLSQKVETLTDSNLTLTRQNKKYQRNFSQITRIISSNND